MKTMGSSCKKRRFRQCGIRWKMLSIILVFILLFALTIWIFQIQMLNYFYQAVKYNEFDKTVDLVIEANGDSENLKHIVHNHSIERYDEIWIYKKNDEYIDDSDKVIVSMDQHDLSAMFLEKNFDALYQKAKANGGRYIAIFSDKYFKSDSYFEFKIIADNYGDSEFRPIITRKVQDSNAIQLDIVTTENGQELIVIQKANLAPTKALIDTIEAQVIFVTIILVLFAVILVLVLSRFITKPIVRVNDAAKKLAQGKYDTEFTGNNYREISELSDTLNYAANELSKNDRLQKELISNISHDLRTPITMIKGYSELMRDIPGENTSENFQIIIDEASRLSELVDAMLDLSKIQSGVRVPQKELFSLTEIVKSTLLRYEKLIEQEGYKIEFFYDTEVFVFADKSMILQVIYNFINNAINYTGEDKYVCVEQKVLHGKVKLSVKDTGDGIPEDKISYIWDRYYKIDKVHKRATVGSGLGLSIAKSVLEAHEASFGVISAVNKGSIFWFELDINDSQNYNVK